MAPGGAVLPALTAWALGPLAAAAVVAAAGAAAPLHAQWPGEIDGRAVDAETGRPLDGVSVEVGAAAPAVSDAAGRFALSGIEPGRHAFVARRLGYATLRGEVEVANGRRTPLRVALRPAALPVDGLQVEVAAAGGWRVETGEPGTGGARTAADLLRGVPGVAISDAGPGGAQTVSIRGSGAGAVLVLVDGVPVNDPLTGEADLSTIPADALASATVLAGALGARYGAGAGGGVVALETRPAPEALRARVEVGSLRRAGGGGSLGGRLGGARWSAALGHETLGGRFDYTLPASAGGGGGERANADLRRTTARAGLEAGPSGALRLRLLHDRLERGLPGRAFAPSPDARQEDARTQLSAAWNGSVGRTGVALTAWGAHRHARHHDAAPPAGLPYDDATRADGWGVDAEVRRSLPGGPEAALGVDVDGQAVAADALAGARSRTDASVRGMLTAGPFEAAGSPRLRGAARLHRDGRSGAWHASHEIAAGARWGPLSLDLAHRSAWTPPALSDLFFREGVAVRANPDLEAERVPSEIEIAASLALERAWVALRGGASAWRGDVEGMVVWAPDYRFVWSPRNVDVQRRGLDAWAELLLLAGPPGALRLRASWSRARATYDREDDPGVQLAYRPRHTATLGASWSAEAGSLALEGRYTGRRNPTPSRANALAGFWAWDATATRTWRPGRWSVETTLGVERLFDASDALIFGFPHPGRTISVEVAVQAPRSLPSTTGDPRS